VFSPLPSHHQAFSDDGVFSSGRLASCNSYTLALFGFFCWRYWPLFAPLDLGHLRTSFCGVSYKINSLPPCFIICCASVATALSMVDQDQFLNPPLILFPPRPIPSLWGPLIFCTSSTSFSIPLLSPIFIGVPFGTSFLHWQHGFFFFPTPLRPPPPIRLYSFCCGLSIQESIFVDPFFIQGPTRPPTKPGALDFPRYFYSVVSIFDGVFARKSRAVLLLRFVARKLTGLVAQLLSTLLSSYLVYDFALVTSATL